MPRVGVCFLPGLAAIDILAQSWLKGGNRIEGKTAMNKMCVVVMLLAALLSATSALASNSCLCVGVSATYMCGGIGGSFGRKHTPSDTLVNSYIQSDKARSYFSSQGKAYDPTTGWLCWKGTL